MYVCTCNSWLKAEFTDIASLEHSVHSDTLHHLATTHPVLRFPQDPVVAYEKSVLYLELVFGVSRQYTTLEVLLANCYAQ
jgi:hypothetical protein